MRVLIICSIVHRLAVSTNLRNQRTQWRAYLLRTQAEQNTVEVEGKTVPSRNVLNRFPAQVGTGVIHLAPAG